MISKAGTCCCNPCQNDCTTHTTPARPGLNSSPYEAWCVGSNSYQFQHKKPSNVRLYNNITKVADYDHDASGNDTHPEGIAPYMRPFDGALPCDLVVDCGFTFETVAAANHDPYCGPWIPGMVGEILNGGCDVILDENEDYEQFNADHNCYSFSGNHGNLSLCRKMGFKNLLAQKNWHGAFGLQSQDGTCVQYLDACGGCEFHPETPTADQTKYLTKVFECSLSDTRDYGQTYIELSIAPRPVYEHLELSATLSIGRYTGDLTVTNCVSSYYYTLEDGTSHYYTDEEFAAAINSSEGGLNTAKEFYAWLHHSTDCSGKVILGAPINAELVEEDTSTGPDIDGSTTHLVITKEFSNTTDRITKFEEVYERGGGTLLQHRVLEITASTELGDPYTAADVYADLCTLAAQVDLPDDEIYPWRRDGRLGQAPMVLYDEGPPASPDQLNIVSTGPGFCDNIPAGTHTGAMWGAFNPAGSAAHFDFTHQCFTCCADPNNGGQLVAYLEGYGAWNPASGSARSLEHNAYFPPCATRWTNLAEEAANFAGAYYDGASIVRLQKWAEIKENHPRHNFARPYGEDRWRFDELHTGCIFDVAEDGDDYIFKVRYENTITARPTIVDNTTPCIITGIPVPGLWTVYDEGNAFDIEGEYINYRTASFLKPLPASFSGSYAFGPQRWPDAASFGARDDRRTRTRSEVLTAVQNVDGVTVDITLAGALIWAVTGDKVDFTGVLGLGSDVAITLVDSWTIKVTGILTGSYSGGGYILPHGFTLENWDDEQPKGRYLLADYTFNFRDWQERERANLQYLVCGSCEAAAVADPTPIREYQRDLGFDQSLIGVSVEERCLPMLPCDPAVVCISPSGEVFANGYTQAFPGSITLDAKYGVRRQWEVIQRMADPLFQRPHKDCSVFREKDTLDVGGSYAGWTWSGTFCAADADPNFFYPTNAWVEPRIASPGPALPAGIYLAPQPFPVTEENYSSNNILYQPPGVNSFTTCAVAEGSPPWRDWLAICGCIFSGGRFGGLYANYGYDCFGI